MGTFQFGAVPISAAVNILEHVRWVYRGDEFLRRELDPL